MKHIMMDIKIIMNSSDLAPFLAVIIYIVTLFGIILGVSYLVFLMMKLIINPILKLKPIRFKDFFMYNLIISFIINGIIASLGFDWGLNIFLSTLITLIYIHCFDPIQENKVTNQN